MVITYHGQKTVTGKKPKGSKPSRTHRHDQKRLSSFKENEGAVKISHTDKVTNVGEHRRLINYYESIHLTYGRQAR
jgi:hypothetical protein